jgi:hypothetical protein
MTQPLLQSNVRTVEAFLVFIYTMHIPSLPPSP